MHQISSTREGSTEDQQSVLPSLWVYVENIVLESFSPLECDGVKFQYLCTFKDTLLYMPMQVL